MITGKPFDVEIVTPERVMFEGKADSVTVPGTHTPFQMLYNHAPIVSSLGVGAIVITDDAGKTTIYATSGGFVQMLHNKASVVVETAEDVSTIDAKRAAEAKRRAEDRLANRTEYDADRSQLALARAVNRLNLSKR
jgi:F-type H+-transporting ATPase subunit epsilon